MLIYLFNTAMEMKDWTTIAFRNVGVELRVLSPQILSLAGKESFVSTKPHPFMSYRGSFFLEKRPGNNYGFYANYDGHYSEIANDTCWRAIILEVATDGKWQPYGKIYSCGHIESNVISLSPLPTKIRIGLNPEIMLPYVTY